MEVASLFNTWLVSGFEQKAYLDCILAEPEEGSLKILLNVFAFLYVHVKANSKEICEEISFPSFFQHFCWDSRLIISKKCVAAPIFLCGFK